MATTNTKKPATRRVAPKSTAEPTEPTEVEVEVPETDEAPAADEMTPSEREEALAAQREAIEELLADMPPLRAPERFRVGHRAAFAKLLTRALTSGVFDGEGLLEFNLSEPAEVARYEAFNDFITSIDEWAESIADDADEYAAWSEGQTADTFMTLFFHYRSALGESRRSAS